MYHSYEKLRQFLIKQLDVRPLRKPLIAEDEVINYIKSLSDAEFELVAFIMFMHRQNYITTSPDKAEVLMREETKNVH